MSLILFPYRSLVQINFISTGEDKRMKKWTIFLSLALVLVLLSACGGGEPAETETPAPTVAPTTAVEPTQEPTTEPTLGELEPI